MHHTLLSSHDFLTIANYYNMYGFFFHATRYSNPRPTLTACSDLQGCDGRGCLGDVFGRGEGHELAGTRYARAAGIESNSALRPAALAAHAAVDAIDAPPRSCLPYHTRQLLSLRQEQETTAWRCSYF